jgi:hypothetical protein
MWLRLYGAHPLLDPTITAEQQRMLYEMCDPVAPIMPLDYEAEYECADESDEIMTSAEMDNFLVLVDRKAEEERARLRHLHPDLKENETTVKVHKAVVDYWLDFVVPTNPNDRMAGRMDVERSLIESRFSGNERSVSDEIMTTADMEDLFELVARKDDEERTRLRHLHADLKEDEITAKVHKAVMDHWLEFVVPTDPNDRVASRINVQKFIIDHWFYEFYGYDEGHKERVREVREVLAVRGDVDAGK